MLFREAVDDFGPPRRVEPAPALPSRAGHVASVEPSGDGVRPEIASVVDERRQQVYSVRAALGGHVQVAQLDRSALFDHRLRLAAHRLHPGGDLLSVRDGRRQRNDVDLGGQMDDHLLPHRAARRILEIVDFVKHDVPQPGEGGCPRVDHVSQDLGRHHYDGRVAVDDVVAGQQPHAARAVLPNEIAELLVRQRLERRRVERLATLGERLRDRVLGHDRLSGTCRCGDEHGPAGVERVERALLEIIERERPLGLERQTVRERARQGLRVVGVVGRSVVPGRAVVDDRVEAVVDGGVTGVGRAAQCRTRPPGQRTPARMAPTMSTTSTIATSPRQPNRGA